MRISRCGSIRCLLICKAMEREQWRDIPGYEGHYQASTRGRIRSARRLVMRGSFKYFCKSVLKKPQPHNQGYLFVHLYAGTVRQKLFVHRVVAMTFLENPDALPLVNHKDRNRKNNRLENLEWITPSGNMKHWRDDERARNAPPETFAFAEGEVPF